MGSMQTETELHTHTHTPPLQQNTVCVTGSDSVQHTLRAAGWKTSRVQRCIRTSRGQITVRLINLWKATLLSSEWPIKNLFTLWGHRGREEDPMWPHSTNIYLITPVTFTAGYCNHSNRSSTSSSSYSRKSGCNGGRMKYFLWVGGIRWTGSERTALWCHWCSVEEPEMFPVVWFRRCRTFMFFMFSFHRIVLLVFVLLLLCLLLPLLSAFGVTCPDSM